MVCAAWLWKGQIWAYTSILEVRELPLPAGVELLPLLPSESEGMNNSVGVSASVNSASVDSVSILVGV